ncbi:hypothetical protein N7468_003184 [Penicillium chermesinum]|uniref:Amidohydrolase-related domain-containing protein n=1 Tax=Penicillium chermesinum TaxID=63820 RepID=A0A9W9P663_9EURO|nr:uncharacterized protein N7468_003184 [Penicillium chermesinum]KAJ5238565.1 hypothetical protein N7468_003184 [Penicillium chermesinum]KAJ6164217.1 hypothetical protein N7470_002889 [Penicillium chermesinum]
MTQFTLHTTALFDPQIKKVRKNISIEVDSSTGLIVQVFERDDGKRPFETVMKDGDIDLRGKYVLPGLVDSHTHVFLHSYDEAGALQQKRDESIVERVLRGANHCKLALMAGYTTYRDLGSEGMQEFDANMRDSIARGIIPGPRLFVATKVIASTGSFECRTENASGGHCLPASADAVDGPEACRQAVRRRIAAGADIIKFFADYRRRIMRSPPPSSTRISPAHEEMKMIVSEAALARCPVSAHCCTLEGALAAIDAGVDSIEHGYFATDEMFARMVDRNVIFVPTLAIAEKLHAKRFDQILRQVKRAHELGVRIACGGDTGTYPHGDNVRELELMIQAGIPVADVLEACTVGGWEACGRDLCGRRFGWFEQGLQADIVALEGDPEVSPEALRKVDFVMKDAQVWKRDGKFTQS